MIGGAFFTRVGLSAAALAAAFVGGCLYRAGNVPAEILAEGQRVTALERECRDGSVCASMLEARAETQRAVVAAAVATARATADAEAERADREARAAAEAQARRDAASLVAANRQLARLEAALASSQECRAWAEQPVPCPLD